MSSSVRNADAVEEVGRRDEVGVENGHELARRLLQPGLERPGLVAGAVDAVEISDVQALRGVPPDRQLGDFLRFVGRVVQDLNLEQVPGIVHLADGVD